MRRLAPAVLALLLVGCGGEKQGPYATGQDLCSVSSVRQVAEEYGGQAGDPESVARAYAADAFDGEARTDARRGCLAAFERAE